MTYLLDTHTWLWRLTNNELLSKKVRGRVFGSPPPYAVSLISVWELAVKIRKRKLALSMPLRDWIETALLTGDFNLIDMDLEILVASQELPGDFHSDPADRIIVATARAKGFTLVTCDDLIRNYPHISQVWD